MKRTICWYNTNTGGAKAVVGVDNENIEIVIFSNRFDIGYGIRYKRTDKKAYRYKFYDKPIRTIDDAKIVAEYEITKHLNRELSIDFK